jgi:hypothetical protein
MRIGGVGIVPAQYDPKSKMITYTPTDKLRPGAVTIIITGKAGGQPVETKWSFKVDPNAPPTGDAAALTGSASPKAVGRGLIRSGPRQRAKAR